VQVPTLGDLLPPGEHCLGSVCLLFCCPESPDCGEEAAVFGHAPLHTELGGSSAFSADMCVPAVVCPRCIPAACTHPPEQQQQHHASPCRAGQRVGRLQQQPVPRRLALLLQQQRGRRQPLARSRHRRGPVCGTVKPGVWSGLGQPRQPAVRQPLGSISTAAASAQEQQQQPARQRVSARQR
jgi:hypothetical protein